MTAFTVPARLAAATARDSSPTRRRWLAELPKTVDDLRHRWALTLGRPFHPGGQASWVAPALDSHGRDVVLKVGWLHPEAVDEAAGLRAWNGDGAVRVYDAWNDRLTSAFLLERCAPGIALNRDTSEPEQDFVISELLRRLWRHPESGHPFRPLTEMCNAWANEFELERAGTPGWLDLGLARTGIELFRSLPAEADESVVLCTDLHAGNVLAARREPWLVIDPKPYIGDRTYDALQHMLNCTERLTRDPRRFARRMADLLDLDTHRLELWLFARCVQESINDPVLRHVAEQLAPG
jgi:streptomycin 6-kinase